MSTEPDFMVITFDPAGSASAMHRDEFPLGFLGKQQITRASEIKFNEDSQLWDVALPGIQVHETETWVTVEAAMGFASYDEGRKFEVLWLEHCALQSIAPLSEDGQELAKALRRPKQVKEEWRGLDDIFFPGRQ